MKNLAITEEIEGIKGTCIHLGCICRVWVGRKQRRALVLKPRAEHIPLDVTPTTLLQYVLSLVDTLDCLHKAGYLHCDLSYLNLLYKDGLPLLADLQTLTPVTEVRLLCCAGVWWTGIVLGL